MLENLVFNKVKLMHEINNNTIVLRNTEKIMREEERKRQQSLRKTHLFIRKTSKKEWRLICEQYLPFDKDFCDELYRFIFTEPYDFMIINLLNMKIYKNFHEVIFLDNELENAI